MIQICARHAVCYADDHGCPSCAIEADTHFSIQDARENAEALAHAAVDAEAERDAALAQLADRDALAAQLAERDLEIQQLRTEVGRARVMLCEARPPRYLLTLIDELASGRLADQEARERAARRVWIRVLHWGQDWRAQHAGAAGGVTALDALEATRYEVEGHVAAREAMERVIDNLRAQCEQAAALVPATNGLPWWQRLPRIGRS